VQGVKMRKNYARFRSLSRKGISYGASGSTRIVCFPVDHRATDSKEVRTFEPQRDERSFFELADTR
jgi:hypothetical protein